jgi:hypothetical protein
VVGQRVVGRPAHPGPAHPDLDVIEATEGGALAFVEDRHVEPEPTGGSDAIAHRLERRRQRVRSDHPAPHIGSPSLAGQGFEVVNVYPLALGDDAVDVPGRPSPRRRQHRGHVEDRAATHRLRTSALPEHVAVAGEEGKLDGQV